MIGDIVARGVAWHFFNYIESWFFGLTNCSNAEPNPVDDVPSTSSKTQGTQSRYYYTRKYREIHQENENSSMCLE